MRHEELTTEEKLDIFFDLQKRHREREQEFRQVIEKQRQEISNFRRMIEDREAAYRMLYRQYLYLKYQKTDDDTSI